jgi:cytochrome c
MNRLLRTAAVLIWTGACVTAAQASAQLALDKGCFACHGDPPRKNAPTFDQLAQGYARYQGQTGQEIRLADKLREGHVFGGIQAHEQLSVQSARALVQWIVQGAR